MKVTGGETASFYCYDGEQVIGEYDNSGTLLRKFVYGPGIDEPICLIDIADNNAVYYYHRDGLGSVVAISDANADIVEEYSYDVYGLATITDEDGDEISYSNIGNPYMFTGRRYNSSTGLYYYRARHYDPEIGRFLQPDPIGYAGGMNLYGYCGNDPTNWTDPYGLVPINLITGSNYISDYSQNGSESGSEKDSDFQNENRDGQTPYYANYAPGTKPPGDWPNPGKKWKWNKEGFHEKGPRRKHWHRRDPRHRPHWDVEDSKGNKIGEEYPLSLIARAALAVGAAGKAVGQGMAESGEWMWEHPRETVLVGAGVGIIVLDIATVPSGEGSVGVIMIRRALTCGP